MSMDRPWSEIRKTYAAIAAAQAQAMVGLISAIESSRYAVGLHGWTSMLDLCITQTSVTYPYDGPFLRVSPQSDGTVEFRYVDTPIKDKQWHRIVPASEAFTRLERFIEQLGWFSLVGHHP